MMKWIIEEKYKDEINKLLCNIDNKKYIKIYKDIYAYKR